MSSPTLIGMLLAIAEYLPVSSYASLAVTCQSMYGRLDHRLWADLRTKDHQECMQLLPGLAAGPLEACSSRQFLHHRDDRPPLSSFGADGLDNFSRPTSCEIKMPRIRNTRLDHEHILGVTRADVLELIHRTHHGQRLINAGICISRLCQESQEISQITFGQVIQITVDYMTTAVLTTPASQPSPEPVLHARFRVKLDADRRIAMAVKRYIWNWYRDMWRCGNKVHNHAKEFDCKLRQATGARHNSDCRCLSVGKQTICRERVSGLCKVQVDFKLVNADTMDVNFWTVLTLSEKRSVIWDLRELFELPSR